MSRFVIDASAALYVLAGGRGAATLDRHEVTAPPLLWSEVTATVRQRAYRRELTPALAARALEALRNSSIQRMTDDRIYPSAYELAIRLGWAKSYAAEYLALASMLGQPLVTADARLARGASGLVEILPASDLDPAP